jgi:O-antigen/teichoic acid export membrane protein
MSSATPQSKLILTMAFAQRGLPDARSLWKSSLFRNVAVVMFGTSGAQAIGIALVPVLSRLYTPADFGVFGSFTAALAVLTAGATLQFSQALVLPRKDDEAARLFLLSCGATAGIAVMSFAVCVVWPKSVQCLFKLSGASWLVWLVPVAVLAGGLGEAVLAWSVRCKSFRRNALSKVAGSGSAGTLQVVLGLEGGTASGLVAGSIVGQATAAVSLFGTLTTEDLRKLRANTPWRRLVKTACQYRDFPLYATPQNVLNATSQGIPVVLLAHYYGAAAAGCYAMAMRTLQAPANLVLNALRQVLLQKAAEAHNEGQPLLPMFEKVTFGLGALVVLPAAVGFIIAPWLFALALGAEWAEAGQYARWLIPWLALGFCNLPAVLFGRILRQQRNLLIYDVLLLICRTGSLVIGGLLLTPLQAVILFSLVSSVFNLGLVVWMGFLVLRTDRAKGTGR